jgi:hypothetical protein
MLFGACKAAVERVEIHLQIVHHIAADHGALIKVNVIKILHQTCGIIEILRGAFAVGQRDRVHNVHGSPCGAVMHVGARQMQIKFLVPRV